jgi:hypothetical protein
MMHLYLHSFRPSELLGLSLLGLSLLSLLTMSVALSIAVPMLMSVSMTVRVCTAGLPVAAAETSAATALHSLGVASRSPATGGSVSLARSLESTELSVALFAEGFELAALLVEEGDVVVAVAVGFVAGGDGVVAQLAGVVEGLGEGFDFDLVFGGFLGGGLVVARFGKGREWKEGKVR